MSHDFIRAALEAKAKEKATLLRALGGIPEPEPEAEAPAEKTPSFDGGARRTVPTTPTHAETLAAILTSRAADTGGSFEA